ncbi:aminotransferase class V-fold PLP-dependent enzyme [Actinotalea sp. C106]|uniref:cysteine desulfurase family protein n=1 Tax=Actinotalea sp. C106 TaxID=2908644 RepID=UPI00202810D0|nr:aminotransferase class V-fold PLP-dependent enzyme [Actinotalea sp. C106]
MKRTYLDAGGRAPLHPAGLAAQAAAFDDGWADPRRLHAEGRRARMLLDAAREVLAEGLACRPEEVHLGPSHTVALQHGLLGIARGRRRAGSSVVLSAVERAALHAGAQLVAERHGSWTRPARPGHDKDEEAPARPGPVPVDRLGRVDVAAWRAAVGLPGVALAVLQHANGEVGTVQPLAAAYDATQSAGVPLLVDAGSSVGHQEIPPAWDAVVADAGDWGAPTPLGVLAVRTRVRMAPDWPEDEDRWFPGGVSVPAALGAAAALRATLADREEADLHRRRLVGRLRDEVAHRVPDVDVVGDPEDRLPHVVTFSCLYVDGEALVTELDRRGFAVGSGSACTSSSLEPSHVLAAMGALTHGNVRVTLPREVPEAEVDRFADELPEAVAQVRRALGVQGL